MIKYEFRGVTIEVPDDGKTARAYRPELTINDTVVQTAAAADFVTEPTMLAQVKANRWAKRLPAIEQKPAESAPPPAGRARKPASSKKELK